MIKNISDHNKKEMKLAKLYGSVPRSTLIAIYRKYKFDYELFGYDFNQILKLAGYQKLSKKEEAIQPWFYN